MKVEIRYFGLLFALTLLLTACGPEPAPTLSPADVQGTSVAAAWTMVAATQQSIPTNTPIPPTPTASPAPPPTFTPPALTSSLPTSSLPGVFPSTTSVSSSTTGGDPCNKPLTANPESKMVNLRLDNQTHASVTLSIYLYENAYGECGYRGYNLASGSKTTVAFPAGCYFFGAFVNDPKKPTKTFGGGPNSCVQNEGTYNVRIGLESIVLNP